MPRPRSGRSDVSDTDETFVEREQELERLKRHYRVMDNERNKYTEDSQNLITKQKKEIAELEEEEKELRVNSDLAQSRGHNRRDDKNAEKLIALSQDKDDLEQEIADEKSAQFDLDYEIRQMEKKIRVQQRNMGGANMSNAHKQKTQKRVRTLENKLDMVNKEFNDTLSSNADLRTEIDSLRTERRRFEALYKKLLKELQRLREEIGEVIEASTQAYEARDDAQAKIVILNEKSEKDIQQHNAEMKELIRIIEHDQKLKDFMNVKGQERHEDEDLKLWKQRKAQEAEARRQKTQDSVETYEAAFERIRQITDEDELDDIVNRFIQKEDQNFAAFNYVNEQNCEIETLQDNIELVKQDIENYRKTDSEMDEDRKRIFQKLEENQTLASKDGDEYEEKNTSVGKILDQLKAGIESVFKKIGCDFSPIEELLGAHQGVTEYNMLNYLGSVEQRTNELLAIRAYVDYKESDEYDPKAPTTLGLGPQPPSQVFNIMAPTIGDEYDSENDSASDMERPFTRNELQNRVIKSVKKRESASRKEGFRYDLTVSKSDGKSKRKDRY